MPAPDFAVSPLTIRLFGPFDVRLDGVPLPRPRTRKAQWLLALLALRQGAEVERAWLAGMLWPDSPEPQAYASLRNSLADLRGTLGPAAERLQSPSLRTLSLDLSHAEVDVVAFDAAIAQGEPASWERAVALYRGPLLEGCAEAWAFQERQAREQAYLTVLEALAAQALAGGEPAAAERHLRLAVAVDPLRETAQRALMQARAAGGNYAAALLTYRELRLLLHRELNAEPDPETQTLFQQLRAEARSRAQAPPSALASKPSSPPTRSLPSLLVPEGTLTFLFTDIEGSTRLWEQHPDAMRLALARHDILLRAAIEAHDGHLFKALGDAFYAAFSTAPQALAAALASQRALQSEPWGRYFRRGSEAEAGGGSLRVRMALHTGVAEVRDGDYFGPALNRVARLLTAGHGGQVLLSQATCHLVREALPEDVSLTDLGAHRLKDLQQPEHLFQLLHPALPADFPPLHSLEVFAHNLPRQLTSFIGREREMGEVKEFLATTRLLTLTGSGGCGKTRLALQVAADLLEAYADGVWLVELAALADPTLVPQTVASALGVREQPVRPLTETLVDYLQPKVLLLILDNCEHLLTASAQLANALLRSCPRLRMLASSRQGLGIAGERTYRVPSLSLPQPRPLPPVERLTDYEAVRLFVERAVFTQPSFAITDQNAPAVAQVCERLDGIPLAIELAAARVKALPVEKLNERLDDMFRLLTGGSRTALPRQQTLRALIDWSYDLLTETERSLLRRLSVFSGGWTLEAAEAVGVGEGIEEWEVLDLLTSLVEKSLILYEERGGEARYRLLETVRQYARDRLLEAGENGKVRACHRDWFLKLVERESSGRDRAWRDRLEEEHDNLRAALTWCKKESEAEAGLRLGVAMEPIWSDRGYWTEWRKHFAELLALPGAEAPTAVRAQALRDAGSLAQRQGDYGAARALHEESLVIYRELGDKRGIAGARTDLGDLAQFQGDYETAHALLNEGLAILRELGDQNGIAASLTMLGWVASQRGDHEEARALYEEARALTEEGLAIFRELGDRYAMGLHLGGLALVARALGNYGEARALLEEGLAIHGANKFATSFGFWQLAMVTFDQGNCGEARRLYEQSLAISRELGHMLPILGDLEGLAAVAVAQAQPERAARLFGAAEGLREAIGAPLPPAERADHDRFVAAVHTALGEEAFAAAWAAGRALSLEQAVEYALTESGNDAPSVSD